MRKRRRTLCSPNVFLLLAAEGTVCSYFMLMYLHVGRALVGAKTRRVGGSVTHHAAGRVRANPGLLLLMLPVELWGAML
jgi:hypothetical protein